MHRTLSIASRKALAVGLLVLLPACAGTRDGSVTIEAARASLQAEYPDLLRSFDLHLGTFNVDAGSWATLSPEDRAAFVASCSRARREVTKRTAVRAEADGRLLVVYDGRTTVSYDGAAAAAKPDPLPADASASAASRSVQLVSIPRPVYPTRALQAGVQGTVVIHVYVGADGSVHAIRVVDGGIDLLNDAALDAVRKARFRPLGDGDPVWIAIPMHFKISEEKREVAGAEHGGSGTVSSIVGSAELGISVSGGAK
jgi:TonB family protein